MKIILNGQLDDVIALRKALRPWTVRAWGITIKECFIGIIKFRRVDMQSVKISSGDKTGQYLSE